MRDGSSLKDDCWMTVTSNNLIESECCIIKSANSIGLLNRFVSIKNDTERL